MTYWEFDGNGRRQLTGEGRRLLDEALDSCQDPTRPLWRYYPNTARWAARLFWREPDEFRQAALIGIWHAALRYAPNAEQDAKGVEGFLGFAANHVRDQVQRAVRAGRWKLPMARVWHARWLKATGGEVDFGTPDPGQPEPIDSQCGAEDQAETRVMAEAARSEIRNLPERQREAVLARFGMEEASYRSISEMAKAHGVTRQGVYESCNLGLEKLRAKLGAQG